MSMGAATTLNTAYDAVMAEMGGWDLVDNINFGGAVRAAFNAETALRTIGNLTRMERYEVLFVMRNLATGFNVSYGPSMADIIRECDEVDPSNMPAAYRVERTTRGYKVQRIC